MSLDDARALIDTSTVDSPEVQSPLDQARTMIAPSEKTSPPSLWDRYLGLQEGLLHGATGMVGSMVSGVRTVLGGNTLQDQIDKERVKQGLPPTTPIDASAITYSPRTDEGKKTAAAMDTVGSYFGQKEGDAAGDYVMSKTNSPLLAAAANTAANVPQFLLGAKAAKTPGGLELKLPKPYEEQRSPVDAQAVLDQNISRQPQSMGAAAATRDISVVTPGLRQAIVEADKSGLPINQEVLDRQFRAHTLPVPSNLSEGQATRDPQLYSDELNNRSKPETGGVLTQHFNDQAQNLKDNVDAIRQESAPAIVQRSNAQHGQALIDAYKDMDAAARANISAKYQALQDANGGEFPIGGRTLNENIDAALAKNNREGMVPADIQRTLDKYRDGSRQMTFNDFESLRSDAADAMRSATNGRERNAAQIVREQLEALPLLPKAANLKGIADQARAAAAARFARIESDPAYEAVVDDKTRSGESSPLADKFVDKYLINGKRANIVNMRSNLSGNPEVPQTIEASTLNHLKNSAGIDERNNGVFRQSGWNGAINNLDKASKADVLLSPETEEKVRALGDHARDIQVPPAGASVNSSNTFVAAVRDHALSAAEHLADAKTAGLYSTFVKPMLTSKAGVKAARESTKPGAGLTYQGPKAPPP